MSLGRLNDVPGGDGGGPNRPLGYAGQVGTMRRNRPRRQLVIESSQDVIQGII